MGEDRQIARVEEVGYRPDRPELDTATQFGKIHVGCPLNLASVGMRSAFAGATPSHQDLDQAGEREADSAKSIAIRMLTEIRGVRLMAKSSRVSPRLDPRVGSGLRAGRRGGTVRAAVSRQTPGGEVR